MILTHGSVPSGNCRLGSPAFGIMIKQGTLFSEQTLANAAAVLPAEAMTRTPSCCSGIRERTDHASSSLKVVVSSVAPFSGQYPLNTTHTLDSPMMRFSCSLL